MRAAPTVWGERHARRDAEDERRRGGGSAMDDAAAAVLGHGWVWDFGRGLFEVRVRE
jgi:hypothetical protein